MEQIQSKQKIVRPSSIEIENGELDLTVAGVNYNFKLSDLSSRLASASSAQIQHFTLSPSGYGIHWPDIDEDISIPALIKTNK